MENLENFCGYEGQPPYKRPENDDSNNLKNTYPPNQISEQVLHNDSLDDTQKYGKDRQERLANIPKGVNPEEAQKALDELSFC